MIVAHMHCMFLYGLALEHGSARCRFAPAPKRGEDRVGAQKSPLAVPSQKLNELSHSIHANIFFSNRIGCGLDSSAT